MISSFRKFYIGFLFLGLICLPRAEGDVPQVISLPQALQLALKQNLTLQIASQEVIRASERTAAARTDLLPLISLSGQGGELLDKVNIDIPRGILGLSPDGSPLPINNVDISTGNRFTSLIKFSIAQPLTQISRIKANIALSKTKEMMSMAQERESALTLTTNVRTLYYGILETQSAQNAEEANLAALRELEQTVKMQVAQQTALNEDLLEVEAKEAQQKSELLHLQDTITHYKEQLNLLMGRGIHLPLDLVNVDIISHSIPELTELMHTAMIKRPDLQKKSLQLIESRLERRQKLLGGWPDLSLAMSYYQLGSGINGFPDHIWTIGFQFKWRPFDWGERMHEVSDLSGQVKEGNLALMEARQETQIEVEDSFRKVHEAESELEAARINHSAALEQMRVTMNRYKQQASLLKDVIASEAILAESISEKLQAGLELLTAQANLRAAIGEE